MSLEGKTHEEVVQLLKDSTGPHVTLTLKRDSSASPLLRNTAETSPVSDHVTVFKSALKTPMLYQQSPRPEEKTIIIEEPQNNLVFESEDDVVGNGGEKWKTICKIPLPLAFVSRYLWATDKLRSNAFEVRSVDGRSSGIIHCEDRKALEQWVQHIDSHINALNRKTIRMSNKYLHASDRIAFIGWLEERRRPTDTFSPTNTNNNYYNTFPVSTDPRQQWAQRFLIFKGADVCLISAIQWGMRPDKCAKNRYGPRIASESQEHYCSFQSREQLHRFEIAFYGCLYKSVNTMQTRTFACSYDGRPAGLVIDTRLGFSLYDIPSKSYIWQYGFSELESSSDDGKMRVQFIFRNDAVAQAIDVRQLDVKDIECDEPLALVFTLHSFYIAKIMGADPEFLQDLPLS
uniref:Syntrophin split Pleckstrin homology (PH) domain-containing protein n=1 Tax=Meloidogyne floridensis TaxID=298350 RepID=A0A915P4S2_9BILA